jgi:glucose-1-phosphate cytidylyltransferase
MIKEYFANYFLHMSDVTIDLLANTTEIHQSSSEPWRVTLIDTGERTGTGGRLKRVKKYVENDEAFFFTYGDGLSDINIGETLAFHSKHNGLATMAVVKPASRFGAVKILEQKVTSFVEKPVGHDGFINGGFFVLSPKVIDYIDGDSVSWEDEPLKRLVEQKELYAYRHDGFWQPMDTLREKIQLENLWQTGKAPWSKDFDADA